MVRVSIVGDRQVKFNLEQIKNKSPQTVNNIIRRSAFHIERLIKENLSNKILNVRTAQLRRSIRSVFGGSRKKPTARIATNLIYARILHEGAIISAKNGPYLCFKIQTASRIIGRSGKRLSRPQSVFQWVKVPQVVIPSRPYMDISFKESLPGINLIIAEETRGLIS